MEWSLTQNKLLAFHRLMRTDKPIGLTAALANAMGIVGGDGHAATVDHGGICRRRLVNARRWMCGK